MKVYNWFQTQTTQFKVISIISLVVLLIIGIYIGKAAYWQNRYLKQSREQIKILEAENENYQSEIANYDEQQVVNQKHIETLTTENKELKEKSKIINDEIPKIPTIVRTYPDRKLDSVLANYRHITPTKNRGR